MKLNVNTTKILMIVYRDGNVWYIGKIDNNEHYNVSSIMAANIGFGNITEIKTWKCIF